MNDPNCAGAAFGELEADAGAELALILAELDRDTDKDETDGTVAVLATLLADTVASEVEDSDTTEVSLTLAVLVRELMTVRERPGTAESTLVLSRRGCAMGLLRVMGGLPEEMDGGPTVGRGSKLDLLDEKYRRD